MTPERRSAQFIDVVSEKLPLNKEMSLLDLGCGNGSLVFFLDKKINSFGCDFKFKDGPHKDLLQHEGKIRIIDEESYTLPFDSNSFDVVISDNVLEHAMDIDNTISEINRVLKKGGCSLHFFPSMYRPIEVHKNIPFGSIIKHKLWLSFFAALGIKTNEQRQKKMSISEITLDNYNYLTCNTNYLSRSRITNIVSKYFSEVLFLEKYFIKHSDNGKKYFLLFDNSELLTFLFSTFRTRVLYFSGKLE